MKQRSGHVSIRAGRIFGKDRTISTKRGKRAFKQTGIEERLRAKVDTRRNQKRGPHDGGFFVSIRGWH